MYISYEIAILAITTTTHTEAPKSPASNRYLIGFFIGISVVSDLRLSSLGIFISGRTSACSAANPIPMVKLLVV